MQFIHSCNQFGGKKDGLERMRYFMECLGNPQRSFPAVHIAGTNGKGSTAAILANILKEAGYKTGLFTSPYLVRFNERIRINNMEIPDGDLILIADHVRKVCGDVVNAGYDHPLEFEVVTAIGFCYFAQQKTDIAVIEVGIGGLLDSTNVIDPLLSVITSVSLDHTAILGDTLELIAAQKAGIIKKKRPVVCAPQSKDCVFEVIRKTALEKDAPLSFARSAEGRCVQSGFVLADGTLLPLPGAYQAENLGTVLQAVHVLNAAGLSISSDTVRRGISTTVWHGRCQWVGNILIDGAHNPDACRMLADYLASFVTSVPVVLLYTGMKDKNTGECIRFLAPCCSHVFTTQIMPPRGESAEQLAQVFRENGLSEAVSIDDPTEAFSAAKDLADRLHGVLVVCGSLYLAGHALGLLQS